MADLEVGKWVAGQRRPLFGDLHIMNGIYFRKTNMYVNYAMIGVKPVGACLHFIRKKVIARYFHYLFAHVQKN